MMIKFAEMPEKTLEAFYGGNDALRAKMYVDEHNKILRGRLVPDASIGLHTHETSSEIIFVLTGKGKVICDGVEQALSVGDCHYCPKGSAHTLINDGEEDLCFYAVVPNQ